MTIARIRRFVLKIVKAFDAEGVSSSPSSASAAPFIVPERVGVEGGHDRVPWVGEMAAPSFMILSTRPRPPRR